MCYQIELTDKFQNDIKYYIKKKKYTNILSDLQPIMEEIKNGNLVGTVIDDLQLPDNEDTYKVRAINSNTNDGKSNGYRVIYYAVKNDKIVYMLTVYYKKDDERVLTKKEIREILTEYCSV